jgi:aspartyl/asparaginyl beta-hydroxylase (cupin superfamily)
MNDRTHEGSTLTRAGAEALSGGDFARARACFERAVAGGGAGATTFVGLAYACRGLDDPAATLAAVDRALGLEPRNLRALVLKGDCLSATGDDRAASSFYLAAVRAAPPPDRLPPDLRAEIARASAACERYGSTFESSLRERIGPEALAGLAGERFAQSLDILVGRKAMNVQRPRYYYFPGLAAIPFHPREAFPFLDAVEAATDEIRMELLQVLADGNAFEPYIKSDPRRPRREQDGLLDNPAWGAFYLWKDGARVDGNAARCPNTMRILESVPLCRATNRSPSVLFSLLRAGAHIPPHTGMVNTRLICHLPLIVPGSCTFRVGNETRDWVEGKAWVFDDTIEHEAWNRSSAVRVILLFEIWRPELTGVERDLVSAMFAAIDAHTGRKPDWEI